MTGQASDDIASRLDQLESRQALRDLVSLYCVACDDHDLDTVVSLFTEDGVFRNPDNSAFIKGHDAILSMFVGSHDFMRLTNHWIHDHLVTFEGPDAATGLALGHIEANLSGTAVVGAFRYYDKYVRQQGKWLFEERRIEFLYYTPVAEFATALDSVNRVIGANGMVEADYPEKLESWKFWKAKQVAAAAAKA